MDRIAETRPGYPGRLRIGVTGHRTLTEVPTLEALTKQAIGAQTWGTAPDPSQRYTVVSPLAEGADRIVARAVLTYDESRLDAVLPMVLDDYMEDFHTSESRLEFRELLARCVQPVYLRSRRIGEESSDPDQQAELRNAAYEAAGRYVVDHCDVLFALWDGHPSRGRGGTTDIVAYAREQRQPVIRIWDGRCTIL